MFFIMISTKCVERGIMTNSLDLSVKFASKAQNECIKYEKTLCNFTPNSYATILYKIGGSNE